MPGIQDKIKKGIGGIFAAAQKGYQPERKMHKLAVDALVMLQNNPTLTDTDIADALGLAPDVAQPFIARAKQARLKEQLMAQPPQKSTATPASQASSSTIQQVKSGNVTLITYSPEELLQQVEQARSSVTFGLTNTAKFMDNYNQIWSWAGPILFALGTIGEIFIVLWERQKSQNLFTAFTIVAVSLIAEGTLLGVSFASKRLRNRADKHSTGWTEQEKHKLETLKKFWFALAIGVAATQIAFIVAQTVPTDIGTSGVWMIAVVRSLVALVADCYTAFASEEKPTSGDVALEVADQEIQFTKKKLDQKAVEVTTLNAGAIAVQEVGIKAEMAQDLLTTQKEIAQLQNKAQIETLKSQQEQNTLFTRMQNSTMRAVFDPEMPMEEKQAVFATLAALMNATQKQLPQRHTSIEEEDQLNGL